MIKTRGILVVAMVLGLLGCGYHLIGTGASSLPTHLKTLSISTFVNNTQEPEIEREITAAVRELFIRDGRLKIVSSQATDSDLKGEIRNYYLKPISFDTQDRVKEYRVLIDVEIVFKDLVKEKVLLKQGLTADDTYTVSAAIAGREATLRNTRKKAFEEFAERIRSLVFEGF
jgi:outer membrane lipopolysaccharide assembly protein LptE/RlpB